MSSLPFANDRIAVVSITRHGIALAGRIARALPGAQLFAPAKFRDIAEAAAPGMAACYEGKTADQIPGLFKAFDAIVAVVSLGAMVRLIAPHLGDKESDPGVVALDEAGRFAIPMLSGHLGGANALAGAVAEAIGAQAVLTTASDARQTLAVDLLGRELGWRFEASKAVIVKTSAAVVNDEPVAVVQETGSADWWCGHANGRSGALPGNIQVVDRIDAIDPHRHGAVLWITHRHTGELPAALYAAIADRLVVYRPAPGAAE
ncbi:cobalamin biosynthesis central domain-containing protein [Denitromonas halophila]|uniref:Cobalamin biosynthesis protein CbiG n=1 Tax=Denitromonas halophila TaxID=1629404 RepID=A0A557QW68_9RHOO|nr:cobalamin biosynthesis central domain-containing protein [Denitromonas halophila]TVO57157.1 cobalamin biosynthesis protein CbiG [Denitromonas halophila]